ncbi:hypothetical protein [Streptomyces sp. NPDC001743]|uniref:hypothetical protein n=1 Tax=Streptomyces sp. NPDC001743 TaxID=3154397 RepID=UPI00332A50F9
MVTVTLTETPRDDADAVFGVLRKAFPTHGSSGTTPQEELGDHPAVWTAEFEATGQEARTEAAASSSLSAPVAATLQGSYVAVDRIREVLSETFAVEELGTASGDQEKEVDLRLRTK